MVLERRISIDDEQGYPSWELDPAQKSKRGSIAQPQQRSSHCSVAACKITIEFLFHRKPATTTTRTRRRRLQRTSDWLETKNVEGEIETTHNSLEDDDYEEETASFGLRVDNHCNSSSHHPQPPNNKDRLLKKGDSVPLRDIQVNEAITAGPNCPSDQKVLPVAVQEGHYDADGRRRQQQRRASSSSVKEVATPLAAAAAASKRTTTLSAIISKRTLKAKMAWLISKTKRKLNRRARGVPVLKISK